MPNWVNVKLSAHEDVINAITDDKGDVNFELIMPIPPDLKDYWTGSTVSLQEQAKDIVENKWEYGNGQHQIPMTEKTRSDFVNCMVQVIGMIGALRIGEVNGTLKRLF